MTVFVEIISADGKVVTIKSTFRKNRLGNYRYFNCYLILQIINYSNAHYFRHLGIY